MLKQMYPPSSVLQLLQRPAEFIWPAVQMSFLGRAPATAAAVLGRSASQLGGSRSFIFSRTLSNIEPTALDSVSVRLLAMKPQAFACYCKSLPTLLKVCEHLATDLDLGVSREQFEKLSVQA